MGQNLSLRVFQTLNDIHITLGSGLLGILILIRNGLHSQVAQTFLLTSLTVASLKFALLSRETSSPSANKVVFITGCDSGLGYSLAQHACEMGFCVFAGCFNVQSEGAKSLTQECDDKLIHLVELDITKNQSVNNAVRVIQEYLIENNESVFWALINNAGVMVFGEFEWQTENLIRQQLEVNLFGTMRVTKSMTPLLRQYCGRVITVSSHCATATLPGLAVYGATKAGISAWSDGLRVELNKYGVEVTMLVPGSFIQQSNIMSRLNENVFEMQEAMSPEQREFYGDYFRQYNSYLSALSGIRPPTKIQDARLYEIYENTLLDVKPKRSYTHEPWRYTFYHTMFRLSPVCLRDYLIVKFVQMPEFDRGKRVNRIANVIA